MPAIPSGTPACPASDARRRLAAKLTDMIQGAAKVAVGFTDPVTQWPHAYARAADAAGRPVRLSPVARRVVARWAVRACPDVDWTHPSRTNADSVLTLPMARQVVGVLGGHWTNGATSCGRLPGAKRLAT